MLDDDRDAAAIVEGMRLARRLWAPGPSRGTTAAQSHPEPDEEWTGYARRTYDSYHDGAGTCRMARDGEATGVGLNARLQVRGLRSLRVADASVMPTVVRGNTNLTALMIGERCADFIREGG